jgi:Amt family ammonium transporter
VIAAIVSNIVVYYKQKSALDDTLDVFPCHGVGGMVGMLLTGVFATKAVNGAGADGLWLGNASFLWIQFKGMIISVVFSFTMSYIIFKFINFIQPIRVSSEEEELGLDATQHNEKYLQGHVLMSNGTSELTATEIEKGTVYVS